jgi:hypothetical protein
MHASRETTVLRGVLVVTYCMFLQGRAVYGSVDFRLAPRASVARWHFTSDGELLLPVLAALPFMSGLCRSHDVGSTETSRTR